MTWTTLNDPYSGSANGKELAPRRYSKFLIGSLPIRYDAARPDPYLPSNDLGLFAGQHSNADLPLPFRQHRERQWKLGLIQPQEMSGECLPNQAVRSTADSIG